jgi:hypothetical protein
LRNIAMMRLAIVAALVLVGLALLILAATWGDAVSNQAYWSDAQAKEYTDASAALKAAAMSATRVSQQENDPELSAARARFDSISADLDRAIAARDRGGILFLVTGIVALLLGAIVFITRPPAEATKSDELKEFRIQRPK